MPEPSAPAPVADPTVAAAPQPSEEPSTTAVVTDELLVEDVSIDGMCGVY